MKYTTKNQTLSLRKTRNTSGLYRKTYLKGKHPLAFKTKLEKYGIQNSKKGIVCNTFPNRDSEFAGLGFEITDNSLLNIEKKVPGTSYPLSQVSTETLKNTPGIYAIRCIRTNRHLVGETKNIKNRIPRLLTHLNRQEGNSNFVSEFNEYGIENFVLILYETGETCVDFNYRKFIEYKLQSELSVDDFCYNSGLTETRSERTSGEFSTSPGIYCIRCKINNACYFGETGQKRGIAGRIASWRSRLRNGRTSNQVLQYDWQFYGESSFEFLEIDSGVEWGDEKKRKIREAELKKHHEDGGGIIYNTFDWFTTRAASCPLAARETILFNQSAEYRDYISHLNRGRINEYRKPIYAEGNIYLSVVEASESLNMTRAAVRKHLKSNTYQEATLKEVTAEKERRESSQSAPIGVNIKKRSTGIQTKVLFRNKIYDSMSEAARDCNITPSAVSAAIKRRQTGSGLLDSQNNRIDNQSNTVNN
jgi:hypothetical protein